jgi:hypothetical protein
VPVLIYERIRTAAYLHIFKHYLFTRYRNELRFVGEVPLHPSAFRLLANTEWLSANKHLPTKMGLAHISLLYSGARYQAAINDALATIMATARLDDGRYIVREWSHKKGQLVIYVTKEKCLPSFERSTSSFEEI